MRLTVEQSEQEFDGVLFRGDKSLARMLGWTLNYHTLRSKGSASGFPDRVLARERVIFVELKAEKGKVSETQAMWLTGLVAAGGECYLVRPSDLDDFARVLAARAERGIPMIGARWTYSGKRYDQLERQAA